MDHGTRATYKKGCHCLPCRAANAAYIANLRRRHQRGLPILGAYVPAHETWRQLRLLTTEYETEAMLAQRLGHKTGRLQYGRKRVRLFTAVKVARQYRLDILAGLPR